MGKFYVDKKRSIGSAAGLWHIRITNENGQPVTDLCLYDPNNKDHQFILFSLGREFYTKVVSSGQGYPVTLEPGRERRGLDLEEWEQTGHITDEELGEIVTGILEAKRR